MTSTDNKSARRQWLLAAGGVALTSAVGLGVWQAVRPAAGELAAGMEHFWVLHDRCSAWAKCRH